MFKRLRAALIARLRGLFGHREPRRLGGQNARLAHMGPHNWATDPVAAARRLGAVNSEAGTRLTFAVETVDGLHYLTELDSQVVGRTQATDVLGHNWQVVDMAHTRWATGSAITALDLCAAALGRLHGGISGAAHDLSVPSALKASALVSRPPIKAWLDAVDADADYRAVRDLRRDLTHQVRSRAYSVALWDTVSVGGGTVRGGSGSSTARTQFPLHGQLQPVAVGLVLALARDLATRHVESFLKGIDTTALL